MRKLVAIAAMGVIAAVGLTGVVGCGSNTAAESKMQEVASVVTAEIPSEKSEKTGRGMAAMAGVRQFKADARFAEATEVVMLGPADMAEADSLNDLQIDPETKGAVTVFLAPPGMPIAMYEGATSKDQFVETVLCPPR